MKWNSPISTQGSETPWSGTAHYLNSDMVTSDMGNSHPHVNNNGTAQYPQRDLTLFEVEQSNIKTVTCQTDTWHPLEWNILLCNQRPITHVKWNSLISTKGPDTPWSRTAHYLNIDLPPPRKMKQPNIHTGTWHPFEWNSLLSKQGPIIGTVQYPHRNLTLSREKQFII